MQLCESPRLVSERGVNDRGRDKGFDLAPPSEPDGRISRIRLSSQWGRSPTIVRVHSCSVFKLISPQCATHSFGQRWWVALIPLPTPSIRHCSRLLNRRLTYPLLTGFASRSMARPSTLTESELTATCLIAGLCYGLVVLVPLLSTPHYCDAVTVRFRTALLLTGADFHRSILSPSQAHERRALLGLNQSSNAPRDISWLIERHKLAQALLRT